MSKYAVLSGRIKQQLKELDLEYRYALEQAEQARNSQIEAYWIAAGFGLQGFYTGIEKIFEQIARVVDDSLMPQSDRWHQELLEQMRTEIPGIRPAVINDNLYQPLRAYLGFRHVVRNNYTHRLEPKLIAQNMETLSDTHNQFVEAILDFCNFLEKIDLSL